MADKYIRVSSKEEADHAIAYFEGQGYKASKSKIRYHSGIKRVAANTASSTIWFSGLNDKRYFVDDEEVTIDFHKKDFPCVYIKISSKEEADTAIEYLKSCGYTPSTLDYGKTKYFETATCVLGFAAGYYRVSDLCLCVFEENGALADFVEITLLKKERPLSEIWICVNSKEERDDAVDFLISLGYKPNAVVANIHRKEGCYCNATNVYTHEGYIYYGIIHDSESHFPDKPKYQKYILEIKKTYVPYKEPEKTYAFDGKQMTKAEIIKLLNEK